MKIKKVKKETKQKFVQGIFNFINIIFALIIIALGLISIFNKDLLIKILSWFEYVIQGIWNWNYLVAFWSSLIEAFPVLGVVVPWQNIMLLVAIFFAKKSWWSLIWVYIVAIVGAIIWNYVWYALWRKYWDSFFKKYWVRFWVWVTEVKYLKKWIHKWWPIWITFWKFHNVTRAFLPFIAGSMWMRERSFVFYNTIGSILRAITIITLWAVFGKYYETIVNHIWKIVGVMCILLLAYLYFFKKDQMQEYIKEKSEELDNL